MNLDKLIKLVKLANNNPNDNEANLAARKVCLMIAENNYKFNELPSPGAKNPGMGNPDTASYWEDLLRNMRNQAQSESARYGDWEGWPKTRPWEQQDRNAYYEEQKRQNEQRQAEAKKRADRENFLNWERSTVTGQYYNRVTNEYMNEQEFNQKYKRQNQAKSEQNRYGFDPYANQYNPYANSNFDPSVGFNQEYEYDFITGERKKKEKPPRVLECRTCHNRRSTKFQGYEAYYECDNCQWTAYTRAKKDA